MLIPFLKWAGGKRWLVDSGELRVPEHIKNYIEPFVGGGAVFFALRPERSILSDLNGRLVETYRELRDRPLQLESTLRQHASMHSDDYYYHLRDLSFEDATSRAAQFLYLNRTCFNGIYRENLKGQFNVPRGSKNNVLLDTDNFEAWSEGLKGAEVVVADFESSIERAQKGDFIFVDPPYTVRHNNNGFVKYNQKIFSWEDQVRLAMSLRSASARGANFVLTNADHASIRELYEGFAEMRSVKRSSVIAASSEKRGGTTELLISWFSEEASKNTRPITDLTEPRIRSQRQQMLKQAGA